MDIKNEFVVPLDPAKTWKVLLDIKRIMPCVPGAELLEMIDERTYKGKVSVKLGPVALSFVGTARFEELDEAARKAKVFAKGNDAKGRGGAVSVVQFRLEPFEDGTRVFVDTNVNLSGSVAQYGRGTGVIQGVASHLTAQFAQNLKALLAHEEENGEAEPVPVPPAAAPTGEGAPQIPSAAPVSQPSPILTPMPQGAGTHAGAASSPGLEAVAAAAARAEAAAARAEAAAARVETAVGRVEAAAARVESATAALRKAARPPAPIPHAKPISGISLMLSVLWGMITGLFSGKKNA